MGKMSQRKGRNAELELCRILNDNGVSATPGTALNYGAEPDIRGVEGVHVECKRCESLRLSQWLEQAQRDSEKFGGLPAVFFRKSREDWNVVMPLTAWLELYQQAQGCKCGGSCCRQNE